MTIQELINANNSPLKSRPLLLHRNPNPAQALAGSDRVEVESSTISKEAIVMDDETGLVVRQRLGWADSRLGVVCD